MFLYNNEKIIVKELVYFWSALRPVANYLPQLYISIFDNLIGSVTGALIEFEQWDFRGTEIQHEIWRTYLAMLIHFIIFLL